MADLGKANDVQKVRQLMHHFRFIIVGAGPTGLGAAWRLHELGQEDWLIVEAEAEAGGLARSFVDEMVLHGISGGMFSFRTTNISTVSWIA